MIIYVIFDGNDNPVGYARTEEDAVRLCQETAGWCWSDIEEMEP